MDQSLKDYNYVFVHIPKNAGTSFALALENNKTIKYVGHGVIFKNIEDKKRIYVLREPSDRFSSSFFFLKKYGHNRLENIFHTPEDLLNGILEFDSRALGFMKIQASDHQINGERIHPDWAFAPQHKWVFDPWRVLDYSNLKEDVSNLEKDVGEKINVKLKNKSKRVDFEYSSDSMALLKTLYSKDFELYSKYSKSKSNV